MRNRATVFSLGNRDSLLSSDLMSPLIVPHAAQQGNERVCCSINIVKGTVGVLIYVICRTYFLYEYTIIFIRHFNMHKNYFINQKSNSISRSHSYYKRAINSQIFLCNFISWFCVLLNEITVSIWEFISKFAICIGGSFLTRIFVYIGLLHDQRANCFWAIQRNYDSYDNYIIGWHLNCIRNFIKLCLSNHSLKFLFFASFYFF